MLAGPVEEPVTGCVPEVAAAAPVEVAAAAVADVSEEVLPKIELDATAAAMLKNGGDRRRGCKQNGFREPRKRCELEEFCYGYKRVVRC